MISSTSNNTVSKRLQEKVSHCKKTGRARLNCLYHKYYQDILTEAVTRGALYKKMFLEISQN